MSWSHDKLINAKFVTMATF